MTPERAISAVQQLCDRLPSDEPFTFLPAFKENLDEVLKLACKGAGVEHPQTGYRGGIIFVDDASEGEA